MIQPNELRIGNWVKDSAYENPYRIQEVRYDMHTAHLSGIELSEDWLIKFGFEKTVEHTWSFGYDKEYNVYRKSKLTYNGIQDQWWYHGALEHQPKYVHQLQNLYHSLTGEELTLSE